MFDLIEMNYLCEKITCYECPYNTMCDIAWVYGMFPVEEHFYSIHYADGEI